MSNASTSFIASLKSSKGGKTSWTYEEDRAFLYSMLKGIGSKEREKLIPGRSPAGFYAKKASLTKMLLDAGATDEASAYAALAAKHGVKEDEEVAS